MLLIVSLLLSALVFQVLLAPLIHRITRKMLALSMAAGFLLAAGIFSIHYQPPPFPEHHKLTITALGEKNPFSSGTKIEVIWLRTVSKPENNQKRLPVSYLALEGAWQNSNEGYGLIANSGKVVSATFEQFMQGGMNIEFQTGPQEGLVYLEWDEVEYTIDLYAPQSGILKQDLPPALDWQRADTTRKILVAGAFATDFFGLAAIFIVCGMLAVILIPGNLIHLRNPELIILCLVIGFFIQFAVSNLNTPVDFKNPQLEKVLEEILNEPAGKIYRRQIKTIVRLDASKSRITTLVGIEQLPNLIQLDLSDNQISDILPLENLTHLEKLNLRNNNITDLSPLANLIALEYLNVHSNPEIESIAPLENLSNLQTLILANVSVEEDLKVLQNLKHLTYLNLRRSGVKDLTPIAGLTNLEYLNLYNNPEIQSIQPLQNLVGLRTLILGNIPVGEEIAVLDKLRQLTYLNLRNTGLTDISMLSHLSNLEYLNLHSNPDIRSLMPIKNLSALRSLILANVPVGDEVGILKGFPDLRRLNLRNCGITNLFALGELMARGSLQDNPKTETLAALDIRDNPIPKGTGDAYASLRSYWETISDRQPVALPFFSALNAPSFSQPAGFYENSFLLYLATDEPDTSIHFTLDGSEPTAASAVYSTPLRIASRAGEPNRYAAIESVAASWNKPDEEVFKASIVRAKAINLSTGAASAVVTNTYFVGADAVNRYNLPVVSLVTDPDNLFDDQTGIYVLGQAYAAQKDADITEDERQVFANYNQRGREWERPVHIELFEPDGQPALAQDGGVRIHGSGSRRYPQKSLRVYARSEYDQQEVFEYPLFTGQPDDPENTAPTAYKYKQFLLRNSGQDWMSSNFRDVFVQRLASSTTLDTQAGRPAMVFLNGEYWGFYNLQERYDEYYLYNKYGINLEKVSILRQNGELFQRKSG